MSTWIVAYLLAGFVVIGALMLLSKHHDATEFLVAYALALFWPVTLLAIAVAFATKHAEDKYGLHFDFSLRRTAPCFGFRRVFTQSAREIVARAFWLELQIWWRVTDDQRN